MQSRQGTRAEASAVIAAASSGWLLPTISEDGDTRLPYPIGSPRAAGTAMSTAVATAAKAPWRLDQRTGSDTAHSTCPSPQIVQESGWETGSGFYDHPTKKNKSVRLHIVDANVKPH